MGTSEPNTLITTMESQGEDDKDVGKAVKLDVAPEPSHPPDAPPESESHHSAPPEAPSNNEIAIDHVRQNPSLAARLPISVRCC